EDLIRPGLRLQPNTGNDSFSGNPVPSISGIPGVGHDQAGMDTGVHSKWLPNTSLHLGTQLACEGMELHGGLDSSNGIILMGFADAVQRYHLVSHELLDDAAVPLDDLHGTLLNAPHDSLNLFWVEFLVHCRIAADIRKKNRS